VEAHDSSAVLGREEAQRRGMDMLLSLAHPPTVTIPQPRQALPAETGRPQHRHRRWHLSAMLPAAVVTAAVAGMLLLAVAAATRPLLRPLIYLAFLVPLGELSLMVTGSMWQRFRFRTAPGKFRQLVIQITTTGNEAKRVNEIISQIHGYRLPMRYEIWVVTEPWGAVTGAFGYPGAAEVFIVPEAFRARSERKARALEYSRHIRSMRGLDTADVKILFNDDDVTPTMRYICRAFTADYDVCEGVTVPRVHYSTRPLAHFFASHVDDTRTRGCLTYCSVFQGIFGKPLWVHGEGLTATGAAERLVTWDWPVFASEDLTFGQNAAKMGLRWGWFHEYVELTSPWSVKDFFTQRKRWTWGNIHAITRRDVLPLSRALPLTVKYGLDALIVVLSMTGVSLRLTGFLPPGSPAYDVAKLAVLSWLAMFFYCGWVAAESKSTPDSRLLHAMAAAVLSPVSSMLAFAVLVIAVFRGNPRTFEVIRKTKDETS
jgi:hypothetical protein